MTYHVQMSIEGALKLSDKKLGNIFTGNGSDVRQDLKERYARGERLIGADDCEGFNAVTGCPGHKDSSDQ